MRKDLLHYINIADVSVKYIASYCLMLRELSVSDCSRNDCQMFTKLFNIIIETCKIWTFSVFTNIFLNKKFHQNLYYSKITGQKYNLQFGNPVSRLTDNGLVELAKLGPSLR